MNSQQTFFKILRTHVWMSWKELFQFGKIWKRVFCLQSLNILGWGSDPNWAMIRLSRLKWPLIRVSRPKWAQISLSTQNDFWSDFPDKITADRTFQTKWPLIRLFRQNDFWSDFPDKITSDRTSRQKDLWSNQVNFWSDGTQTMVQTTIVHLW